MSQPAVTFSEDQASAYDSVTQMLAGVGINLDDALLTPPAAAGGGVMAVIGKAGSGKTLLLAELYKALAEAGVDVVSGDWEGRRRKDRRTLAILAPTNKAASVLRLRGVPATTIHRILYTPVYDPEYERIAAWLAGEGERPVVEGLTEIALDDPEHQVRDGLTASAVIRLPAKKAFRISPSWITLSDEGEIGIRVVDADDMVQFVPIRILAQSKKGFWISGPEEGMRVISLGQEYVAPGEKVDPVLDPMLQAKLPQATEGTDQ